MQTTRLDQASRSLQLDTTVESKPGSRSGLKRVYSKVRAYVRCSGNSGCQKCKA